MNVDPPPPPSPMLKDLTAAELQGLLDSLLSSVPNLLVGRLPEPGVDPSEAVDADVPAFEPVPLTNLFRRPLPLKK